MSIEAVRAYFRGLGMEDRVMEKAQSSATVELAAEAVGVIPARIVKTLSFHLDGGCMLLAAAGDAKVDNTKYKRKFGVKARMLTPDEALAFTGHAIGGVCPFAIPDDVKVYLDVSIRRFDSVFPACGSSNSMIELTPDELFDCSNAIEWVDVTRNKEGDGHECTVD